MKTSSMTLRITIFFSIVLCLFLSQNLFAQKGDLVLNFNGKDAVTSNIVPLESVKVSNETLGGDTTLYGAAPTLSLQWASGIFEHNRWQQASFVLEPNYPNPFTENTTVNIRLRKPQQLIITLYDQQGAAAANMEQDFGFGTHRFEISVPQNRLCLLTVNDGVTAKTLKMFSTTGKDYRIKYIGTDENAGYKSATETAAFIFQPGNVLKYTVKAAGYYEYITYDNPVASMNYVFSLQPNTTELPPTITTAAITNITATTATGSGTVTSEGSATVTARGVCWNTAPGATIANSFTADGTGMGNFTSAITGLTENTTYYVRAYATNQFGTAYGNEVSFTTAIQELVYRCDSAITYTLMPGAFNQVKIKSAYDSKGNKLWDQSWIWSFAYGIWVITGQSLYTYDSTGNILVELYQGWNTNIGSWVNNSQYLFTYDASGNMLSELDQYWNANIGSWVNNDQSIYTYDVTGNLISDVYQYWNTYIGSWENGGQYLFSYDTSGNMLSEIFQQWYENIGVWGNFEQYLYTYNASGNLLSSIWQGWNTDIGSWVNYEQFLYSYNASGNRLSEIHQDWDSNIGSWVNFWKYLYTYDANGNKLTELYLVWNTSIGSWVNSSQGLFTYNASGKMLSQVYQSWNTNIGSFVNSAQELYTYDVSENILSEINQSWNSNYGTWMNYYKTEYQYDYTTRKIIVSLYEWSGGWTPTQTSDFDVYFEDSYLFTGYGCYKLEVWYNSYPSINKNSDEAISRGTDLFGNPKPLNGKISIDNLSETEAGFENEFDSTKYAKAAWLNKNENRMPSQNQTKRHVTVGSKTREVNHSK